MSLPADAPGMGQFKDGMGSDLVLRLQEMLDVDDEDSINTAELADMFEQVRMWGSINGCVAAERAQEKLCQYHAEVGMPVPCQDLACFQSPRCSKLQSVLRPMCSLHDLYIVPMRVMVFDITAHCAMDAMSAMAAWAFISACELFCTESIHHEVHHACITSGIIPTLVAGT